MTPEDAHDIYVAISSLKEPLERIAGSVSTGALYLIWIPFLLYCINGNLKEVLATLRAQGRATQPYAAKEEEGP